MQEQIISTVIQHITQRLSAVYDPHVSHQYAWWLVQALTQQSKEFLLTHETITLTDTQEHDLAAWLHEMVHNHKPIQYIIGWVPFDDLTIMVEPPILIPRPETEEWCSNLANELAQLHNQHLTILDLCAGTGCIALLLAHKIPAAQVWAGDISEQACALGTKNAEHNNIKNVTFIHSDLFKNIPRIAFDLIVSNPPYIPEGMWVTLDPSVKNWEDKQALIASDKGLAVIKQIIDNAPAYIKNNEECAARSIPHVVIEIDAHQADAVVAYMKQKKYEHIMVHKDLEGNDRTISGRVPHEILAHSTP